VVGVGPECEHAILVRTEEAGLAIGFRRAFRLEGPLGFQPHIAVAEFLICARTGDGAHRRIRLRLPATEKRGHRPQLSTALLPALRHGRLPSLTCPERKSLREDEVNWGLVRFCRL